MRGRLLVGAALVLIAAGLVLYGAAALSRVSQMRREADAMERDIATLRTRADDLTRTVEHLRSDPAYIEKLAREELGYVREGETVLKFPSQEK